MINVNQSYDENISKDENKIYEKMVSSIIGTGDIEAKYRMLFDLNDTVNIITLSFLRIRYSAVSNKLASKQIDNVMNLYRTLPLDLKERLILSLGLDVVIHMGLDNNKEVDEVLLGICRRRGLID